MVDSRETGVDLMVKVANVTILCRIKANLNGRMMKKTRLSGKAVAHTKEVLDPTEEKVILILEVVFMVIVIDVVKKGIYLLNIDLLKVGKIIKNVLIQEDIESSPSALEARENLMVRRTLSNNRSDEEPILRRSLLKTRCKMNGKCYKVIIDSGSSTNLASKELVTKLQL